MIGRADALRETTLGSWPVESADDLARTRADLDRTLHRIEAGACGCHAPSGATPQDIVLIANELAANALTHAGGPARVDLICADSTIVVQVADRRPDLPPRLDPPRDLGQGGYGLRLALRVADDVGWYRDPVDGSKCVWARFTVTAPQPARHPV